ncbi:MAG TPA: cytochrome c biogenesis protein CcdA, partial [Tepidisphaeraceae bacterium]|nr:cytochrome c biogenesis protein CcdA [Tepidisphaeraceae bacterium]
MPRRLLGLLALLPLLLAASPLGGDANLFGGSPEAKVDAKLSVSALQPARSASLAVVIDIPPGLHAQSHTPSQKTFIPLTVTLTPPAQPSVTFGDPQYPSGVDKTYPALGKLNVYDGQVIVRVPVTVGPDAKPGDATLAGSVRLQMCDDKFCYPPKRVPFSIAVKIAPADAAVTTANADLFPPDPTPPPAATPTTSGVDSAVTTTPTDANPSVLLQYGTAFLVGLILNLMPCVLPVLPLKAIGFYETAQHQRGRAVGLAVAFSVGIVLVFAVLAVLILVLRRLTWGEQFSNPYFAWGMVALLFGMALWLMGAFRPLSLPTWAYAAAPRHDTVGGNVLFGTFTALLSTPCTAPLLPPLLAWAAAQPTHVGVPAMLMVGVGMAFPYVLLSAFPQWARRFPRVGPWAELFKQMMGFLLIGSAVYFAAGRLVPGPAFWWPVVAVAGLAAVYLLAKTIQYAGVRAKPIAIAGFVGALLVGGTFAVAARMNGLFVAPDA